MGLSNKEGKIVEKVEYDVYGMPTFLDAMVKCWRFLL